MPRRSPAGSPRSPLALINGDGCRVEEEEADSEYIANLLCFHQYSLTEDTQLTSIQACTSTSFTRGEAPRAKDAGKLTACRATNSIPQPTIEESIVNATLKATKSLFFSLAQPKSLFWVFLYQKLTTQNRIKQCFMCTSSLGPSRHCACTVCQGK